MRTDAKGAAQNGKSWGFVLTTKSVPTCFNSVDVDQDVWLEMTYQEEIHLQMLDVPDKSSYFVSVLAQNPKRFKPLFRFVECCNLP